MIMSRSDCSSQPPAAREAEEDDGLGVGLGRQFPAEIDCGRIGIRVDHGRHLVKGAVSSHRRHGVVSGRPERRRADCGWLSAAFTGGSPEAGLRGRFQRAKDAR